MGKVNRGFADRDNQTHGHSGRGGGLTADQIYDRCAKGQTKYLSPSQVEYAERQGWLSRLLGGRKR